VSHDPCKHNLDTPLDLGLVTEAFCSMHAYIDQAGSGDCLADDSEQKSKFSGDSRRFPHTDTAGSVLRQRHDRSVAPAKPRLASYDASAALLRLAVRTGTFLLLKFSISRPAQSALQIKVHLALGFLVTVLVCVIVMLVGVVGAWRDETCATKLRCLVTFLAHIAGSKRGFER
jgi:uncharacterized protein YhhL (DUF1145 family)